MLLLGLHVSKTSCLDDQKMETLDAAIEFNMDNFTLNCAQIFTHGPQGYRAVKIDFKKIEKLSREINIYSHSAYTTVGVWKDSERTIPFIEAQIIAIKNCGGLGLVLHISRQPPQAVAEIVCALKPFFVRHGITLLLEMIASAAHPELTYETPEKLDNLINEIEKRTRQTAPTDWYGICVDTAHIFASGFDCTKYADMQRWLATMKHAHMIKMFHLNGSASQLGTGRDKHAIPFSAEDNIWGGIAPNNSGLRAVVEFAVKNETPIILEINQGNAKQACTAFDVIKTIAIQAGAS